MEVRRSDSTGALSLIKGANLKPRVVLVLLLTGSFAGVWVSHRGDALTARLFWWIVVVALGVVAGGLYWRLLIFDPSSFEDSDALMSARSRWSRAEAVSVWALGLCGLVVIATEASVLEPSVALVGVGFAVSPLFRIGVVRVGERSRRTTYLRSALFGIAIASLCGFARIETGAGVFGWVVRVGHLGCFALWIGGAVWHNFVVLPTVKTQAVKRQARRFRKHLSAVIPLLLVTGGYQALRLLSPSPSSLVGSLVGWLVVLKLFVLTVLTGLVVVSLRGHPAAD